MYWKVIRRAISENQKVIDIEQIKPEKQWQKWDEILNDV